MAINNITGSFGRLNISNDLSTNSRRDFAYKYTDFMNYCSQLTDAWIEVDFNVGMGGFYFRITTTFSSELPRIIDKFLREQKIVRKGENAYYHDGVRVVFNRRSAD
jgi:hypothetical protein